MDYANLIAAIPGYGDTEYIDRYANTVYGIGGGGGSSTGSSLSLHEQYIIDSMVVSEEAPLVGIYFLKI